MVDVVPGTATARRSVLPILAACLLAVAMAGRQARAEEIKENEALVMRLVFEDCLGFMRQGRTPFQGLPTQPAPAAARRQFPAAMPDRDQIVTLLSPRYVAAWGGDSNGRHCMVQTIDDPWPPPAPGLLGVRAAGFSARVTARATAVGLVRHPAPEEPFSPLHILAWSEPATGHDARPQRPISFSIMPTGRNEDGSVLDAGLIVMGGPPQGRAAGRAAAAPPPRTR